MAGAPLRRGGAPGRRSPGDARQLARGERLLPLCGPAFAGRSGMGDSCSVFARHTGKSGRIGTRSRGRIRGGRQRCRLPPDARQRLGVDFQHLRALSGFRMRSLSRVFRAMVWNSQGIARRKLCDAGTTHLQYLEEFLHSGPRRHLRRVPYLRHRVKSIRSRDNPQIKALIKLAGSSRERRRTGSTILEGEHLVRAYQESGGIAETILVSESALARPELRSFFESVPAHSRLALSDELLGRISQLVSAAGVAAVVKTPRPVPLPKSVSNCLLLENIQDPGNLGSILRTAVAAGVPQVFLSKSSVFAWSPKVIRAGMGAHFSLAIFEDIDLGEIARAFSGRIIATEPKAGASLYELDLKGPVAWLFGNEGSGLSPQSRGLATDHVHIPMPGPAESLNVAAAAAICLFEQIRQRGAA